MTRRYAPRTRPFRWTQAALALMACCLASLALADESFDKQRESLSLATATQPESAVLSMLKAGLNQQHPTEAFALAERWLRENVAQDPLLLFHAGQAAERAADWNAAISLYRQYLKRADLQSPNTSEAIAGSYLLQINHLGSVDDAYAYSRSEGNRLVASAQARQFDRWFLDEAQRRGDHEALAMRLLALAQAKVDSDLLVALYESDFNWLLRTINNGRLDQGRYAPRFIESVKALSKAITFDTELALLLDFSVSVKAYNMAILDGEQAAPPIAQAAALLQSYPDYAEFVQTAWAGSRGRHYRGDPKKYWPLDLEAKRKPVQQAADKLDPITHARYLQSWGTSYYDGYPQILSAQQAREWVPANPQRANSKTAPTLSFEWTGITLEDARKLAPHLAQNPSPEAAAIRALATVDKSEADELDKTVDTLLNSETWRLSSNDLPGYIDRLWHRAGRPGDAARRDQLIARGKAVADRLTKSQIKKEDPANVRLDQFRQLWQDYLSPEPRLIAVRDQLLKALVVTPEAIPQVLNDNSVPAQMLLREALEMGITGTDPQWSAYESAKSLYTDRYSPAFDELARRHYGGLGRLVSDKDKYRAHPLGPLFHKLLAEQIKQGSVQTWVVYAWLNTQFPEENAQSVALMKQLYASPAWEKLPFDLRAGARIWFKDAVMSQAQQAYLAASKINLICKPLLDLPEDADAPATAAALQATIIGLSQSPVRHEIVGLERLAKIKPEVFTDPLVLEQIDQLAGTMRSFATDHTVGNRLLQVIAKERDPAAIHRLAPFIWREVEVHHRHLQQVIAFAEQMIDVNPSAAHALARCGLQTIARHKAGHTYYNRDTDLPWLTMIRGKAALQMRLIDIPVPPTDRAYPIYKSQAEFLIGNVDTARELYIANADQLLPVHRSLSVPYLLWVLQYTLDSRGQAQQESLAKALLAWMQSSATAFTIEQRIALELAYGDIALQRGMLPEAQKIFSQIRSSEDYAASFDRHQAAIRLVLVQRIAKDFDGAMQTLMELDAQKVPRLVTAAHFARAEVYYDMQEYQDAADEIAKVLERDPEHADATILRGRVQLKLQRLIEATEVELGSATAQASLVPGEMLKVTLNDPTLAVSSGGTDIEVVVTATSGDKEYLLLRQFGDQKTKYRGEVRTALGKPAPDDGTLQVIGDDEVYYAYSERFREKLTNLDESRGGPIIVASDALVMASSRKLLSENEQRVAEMRAATEKLSASTDLESTRRTDPERYARLLEEAAAREREQAIQTRVKPGNPIYLRVIDLDRSRSAAPDELTVSVSTSSGDSIGQVVLKETGTHTGQFEGSVNTTAAQAIAFASTTETGRNPNMVISPRADYPAWRPVAVADAQHHLTVDLNDNVGVRQLTIEATDEGFALGRMLVQTAMDHSTWTTVATYPPSHVALDDAWRPSTMVVMEEGMRAPRGARPIDEMATLRPYLESGWLANPEMAIARNVAGPSAALDASLQADVDWKWQGRGNPAVIARFQAYFYEPTSITRQFAVQLGKHTYDPKNRESNHTPEFLLAVDGRVIAKLEDGRLDGQINLKPGLHQLELWATGWVDAIGFGREVKLLANLQDPDVLVDCPNSLFDPTSFPAGLLAHRNSGAQLQGDDAGKRFTVSFGDDSRARLIRLLFAQSQGPVPSINRLTLIDPLGKQLLPVPEDFAELRKNDLLEIMTGDQVAVRYTDDRFVTRSRERHERFLHVDFTDGKIEFADIEPRFSSRHQSAQPYHETLLRFALNQPLSVVIYDADMDQTTEPDRVACTITSGSGMTRKLTAVETGPSTGTFRAWITPVAENTSDVKQIRVDPGGQLTATYRDAENLTPGVAYDRVVTLRHAAFSEPKIQIGHMSVKPFEPIAVPGQKPAELIKPLNEFLAPSEVAASLNLQRDTRDLIRTRYEISQKFLDMDQAPESGLELVLGRHALIEVVAPHLALGQASEIAVYVQTDSGRAALGAANTSGFDLNAPGTLHYNATLNAGVFHHLALQRGGYHETFEVNRGSDYERIQASLQEGRFRLSVPLIPGPMPTRSFADRAAFAEETRGSGQTYPYGLRVKAGERIHVGVSYTDANGKKQWATASARVTTHPLLDVMQEDYRESMTSAHVGEKLCVRVVDPAADTSDERDAVRVYMQSKSGQKDYANLRETDTHSGIFKAVFQLTYTPAQAQDGGPAAGYDVGQLGFPVVYGDTVGVKYTDALGRDTPPQFIELAKGSDGSISPFSKQYDDSETATRTQFAMAESFLELARQHRKHGEQEQAKREFDRAKQLLASTIAQFTDPETRAHAEYLLGNLTMEDAEATQDKPLQAERYHAALARFMKVTGTYADSPFASQSQFKIAVIYERLGEPDIAAQEYVKLAYKYPESEHLATSMARLGTHFQRKAVEYETRAKPLLEDVNNKDAIFEGEVLKKLSVKEYVKAAQIFERLQTRFPSHELAGTAGLRAGQIYMRAGDYAQAVKALKSVIDNESYDGVTLRSEAMYWAGMSHQSLREDLLAYALFKRITYDFPESKWAAYARSQLSTPKMLQLDQKLEIERLEAGQ